MVKNTRLMTPYYIDLYMEENFIGEIIHFCDIFTKREWKVKVSDVFSDGSLEAYVLKSKRIK